LGVNILRFVDAKLMLLHVMRSVMLPFLMIFYVKCMTAVFVRLCKRRPFAFQKAVFYTLKGGLLHGKRPPFGKPPEINP
jgi:hypothetical protein